MSITFSPLSVTSASVNARLPSVRGKARQIALSENTAEVFSQLPTVRLFNAFTAASVFAKLPSAKALAAEVGQAKVYARLPNAQAVAETTNLAPSNFTVTTAALPMLQLSAYAYQPTVAAVNAQLPRASALVSETSAQAKVYAQLPTAKALLRDAVPLLENWVFGLQTPGVAWAFGAVSTNIMQDGLALSDSVTSQLTAFLLDTLVFSDDLSGRWSSVVMMEDRIILTDALRQVLQVTMADGITLSDTLASTARVVMQLADRLVMTDAVATQMQALNVIADALALSDVLRQGALETISDGLVLGDEYAAALQLRTTLVDQLALADSAEHSITMLAVMADTLVFDDTAVTSLQLLALIRDGITFHCRIRIDGQLYVAHVVNTTTRGFSTYDNYPFNGFCELGGKHYATGPGGLFRLDGDDADGDAIISEVRSGYVHLSTNRLKRMPSVYLALKADGRIALKVVTTDNNGARHEWWYERDGRPSPTTRNDRVKIGRGLRGAIWQWALVNADGADFSLDVVELFPTVMERRLS